MIFSYCLVISTKYYKRTGMTIWHWSGRFFNTIIDIVYLIPCMHLYSYQSNTGLDIEEFCMIFSGLLFLSFQNAGLNLTNFVVSNYAKGAILRMQISIPKQHKMEGLAYTKLQNFSLEGDGNASPLTEIAPENTDGGALFVLESKGSQISSSPLAYSFCVQVSCTFCQLIYEGNMGLIQ